MVDLDNVECLDAGMEVVVDVKTVDSLVVPGMMFDVGDRVIEEPAVGG